MRRLAAFLALALAPGALAQALYIDTARVLPGDGKPIECGRIVVRDGVIAEVGAAVERPAWSRAVDATRQVVTPGFIVPATALFVATPPPAPNQDLRIEIKPDAKAADDARSRDEGLALLLDHGVTMVGILPASDAPGIPGLAAAMLTTGGPRAEAVVAAEAALIVNPATHAPWREAIAKAVEKAEGPARRPKRKPEKPEKKADALARALRGDLPVLLAAGSPVRLMAASDVLDLEALDLVVLDGLELWKEADTLDAMGARVLTYPALVRETGTRMPVNRAAIYEHAGIPYAFVLPDDDPLSASDLRLGAIEMIRTGCSREKALAALTAEAAAALGLSEKAGSVAKGRRADLLFWSGDPFDPTTRLERVMVGGRFVARIEEAGR